MSRRTLLAKTFAKRNQARIDHARKFFEAMNAHTGKFFEKDKELVAQIEALNELDDELEFPIAEPSVWEGEFTDSIAEFVNDLEQDVDPVQVMADAQDLDEQDED